MQFSHSFSSLDLIFMLDMPVPFNRTRLLRFEEEGYHTRPLRCHNKPLPIDPGVARPTMSDPFVHKICQSSSGTHETSWQII